MGILTSKKTFGFTLIELLIVIGILAILALFIVLVINPVEILAQTRDSTRADELRTLNDSLNLYRLYGSAGLMGSTNTVYVSLPD